MVMLKWVEGVGYALIILGGALLSPLADFLPLDFAPLLTGNFASNGSSHYFRLVRGASGAAYVIPLGVLLAGTVLVVLARFIRHRSGP